MTKDDVPVDPVRPAPAARRVGAAKHLLSGRQIRESLTLARQHSLAIALVAGLQAALTALIALPLIHISPWPHLIGFASLGTLVALFGRFAPKARRARIVFYCACWQTLAVLGMSTAAWLGAPAGLQILLLALACGLFFFVSITGRFGAPGALIFIFAASASMGRVDSFQQVLERVIVTGLVAALAWIVCTSTEPLRQKARPDAPLPADPVWPLGPRLIAAARILVGSAVAAFAAVAVGAKYPGWAAMGAVAVMQGVHLHISMNRALQRTAGTLFGALLVWVILIQSPSVWAIIVLLVLLTVATEIIIGVNYGLGQILVTPMALLMTYLAAQQAGGTSMVAERVVDTVLGAGVGMAMALILSTLEDRTHLLHHDTGRKKR